MKKEPANDVSSILGHLIVFYLWYEALLWLYPFAFPHTDSKTGELYVFLSEFHNSFVPITPGWAITAMMVWLSLAGFGALVFKDYCNRRGVFLFKWTLKWVGIPVCTVAFVVGFVALHLWLPLVGLAVITMMDMALMGWLVLLAIDWIRMKERLENQK